MNLFYRKNKYNMWSLSVRFHNIFYFFILCLLVLISFNILTTIFINTEPKVNKFNFYSTTLYNNPFTKVQHSGGEIDLDIDFEPCFDWNTNLIFSWISVTYITKADIENTTLAIWDRIMKRDEVQRHIIKQDKVKLKYPIIDQYYNLSNKDIFLKLHWEHMPVIGPIHKHSIPLGNYKIRQSFSIPIKNDVFYEFDYTDTELIK